MYKVFAGQWLPQLQPRELCSKILTALASHWCLQRRDNCLQKELLSLFSHFWHLLWNVVSALSAPATGSSLSVKMSDAPICAELQEQDDISDVGFTVGERFLTFPELEKK